MIRKISDYFIVASFAVVLCFASLNISYLIYNEHEFPYIDEIFHIPQAQQYCEDQWIGWNPKITTLPGLYIVSYILLKPLKNLGYSSFCSVFALRGTNIVATVFNFLLAFSTLSILEVKLKQNVSKIVKLLTAINISIFPPLYFFTFLYYTDVWSMTFVLLLYHSHLKKQKFLAVFSSIMAVLMRQTNIIWVGLMILDEIWNVLSSFHYKNVPIEDYNFTKNVFKKFFLDYFSFKKNKKSFINLIKTILPRIYHYVLVCLLFVTFVIYNGSIVLGDKKAHSPTFHPMQNLYFLDFVAFFSIPFYILEVFLLLKKPPNSFLTVFLIVLCAYLSETNKIEHPYLLADNRHLAFYLWKRFFGHSIFRKLLVPTYVFSAILLWKVLRYHFMFIVALTFCTFLNLTPQHLFELRYFIIPFTLYRLHFKYSKIVILESIFFLAINASVIYLFLNKPFIWPSEPNSIQRIIW